MDLDFPRIWIARVIAGDSLSILPWLYFHTWKGYLMLSFGYSTLIFIFYLSGHEFLRILCKQIGPKWFFSHSFFFSKLYPIFYLPFIIFGHSCLYIVMDQIRINYLINALNVIFWDTCLHKRITSALTQSRKQSMDVCVFRGWSLCLE